MIVSIGFIAWILGYFIDRPAVSIIGAIFILGAGGLVLVEGLEVKTGEIHDTSGTDETVITNQYRDVSTIQQFDVGFLSMVLGAVGIMFSFQKYEDLA